MKKRVFVGVGASEEIKHQYLTWKKDYSHLSIRFTKADNLHLTLVAPWYTNQIDQEITKFKQIQPLIKPFSISFKQIVLAPNPDRARMIWAEGKIPTNLIKLKQYLQQAFNQPISNLPLRLHLTLARFKPKHLSSLPKEKIQQPINWPQKVKLLTLFESVLDNTVSEYKVLAQYKLN